MLFSLVPIRPMKFVVIVVIVAFADSQGELAEAAIHHRVVLIEKDTKYT